MAYVTSPRAQRVATPNGYAFEFAPKKVTWIPDPALPHALAAGCLECDETGLLRFGEEPDPPLKEDEIVPRLDAEALNDDERRLDAVQAAIAYLVAKGDTRDFRKDNTPKLASVERAVGFTPLTGEVQRAFIKYQEES